MLLSLCSSGAFGQTGVGLDEKGFVASIAVGPGGFTPARAWAPGRRNPSAGLHVWLGYRIATVLDIGVHVANQWLAVDQLPVDIRAFAWAAAGGIAVRANLLRLLDVRRLGASVSVGFDFFSYGRQTTWTVNQSPAAVQYDAAPGASVPVSVALEVFLTRDFAIGLTAVWAPWWQTETCTSTGMAASCVERTAWPEHSLFVGLGARLNVRFVE